MWGALSEMTKKKSKMSGCGWLRVPRIINKKKTGSFMGEANTD
jgi:hypothetical protein